MRSWHRDSNHTLPTDTVLLFNPGGVHAPFPANDERWSFRMFYLQDELFEQLSRQISSWPVRLHLPSSWIRLLLRISCSYTAHWNVYANGLSSIAEF